MANSDRFGFEALLAEVAARLGDTPAPAVPREIESALARLIDFFGYDRGTYSNLDAGAALQVVASAAVAGMAPLPRGAYGPELPWLREELRAGRVVALPRLPEDLPPEARAEAEHCQRHLAEVCSCHLSLHRVSIERFGTEGTRPGRFGSGGQASHISSPFRS